MTEKRELIIKHINERILSLTELGRVYSEEKINKLADNLLTMNKPIEDIFRLIDNKFANQLRRIKHNDYLASLKDYYLANIDKLKKGNNCYLLSYQEGYKVLEQAYLEDKKNINPYLTLVSINNEKKGYKKENSISNDYEIIISDIAYLLNVKYARTYRIFDADMNPQGILNETFAGTNERYLNLEETLRFIKEESPKFTLKTSLLDCHDKKVKYGVKHARTKNDYKETIEYVLNLFKALPDISEKNYKSLKQDYLTIKVFELLTNSLNNNLSNTGIIINKEELQYTYELSPAYNKYTVSLPNVSENITICNFFYVEKKELLKLLITNYYNDIKEILALITDNKDTLIPLIDQILKEHLEYEEYNKYHKIITDNLNMIISEVNLRREEKQDTEKDCRLFEINNDSYEDRIAPFYDTYVADDYEENEKGSIILTAIVTTVLFITVLVILAAIYAVSKMDM